MWSSRILEFMSDNELKSLSLTNKEKSKNKDLGSG